MKLLSSTQIHQWDAYTIEHEPVSPLDLMERAAGKCTEFILEKKQATQPIKIFCGKGNNGGDGLVIARHLLQNGYQPLVYILEFGAKGTDEFQVNLQRLHETTTDIYFVQTQADFPEIEKEDFVIDALYGSGLNRPLQGLSGLLVKHLNASGATILAIDVPSGMYIDKSSKGNNMIKAWHTLTFQSLKLCFLLADNAEYFGSVSVLDIGLLPQFLQQVQSPFQLITKNEIAGIVKPRNNFAHKGTYGHALLIAGNTGKMGAALLAAKACLRSGAGLVTLNIPATALNIVQTALPEAMCSMREEEVETAKFTTIGIGPGLGTKEDAAQVLLGILQNFKKPIVIDADALNIISANLDWLHLVPAGSIITPHPKEFERLFGSFDNELDRINKAIEVSRGQDIVIVLKGHNTLVAYKGAGWFNTTGNAGMAKGGSGDILTGIITAFLAQGYPGLNAALAGVYVHGLAGDLALQHQSQESMLASDIIECLGEAFYEIAAD
jgi:NAD(P)H-hydrate epimerase